MNRIKLNIKGKNIERFIKRLNTNNIELLKIEYIKNKEINIIIKEKDYERVIELKSIYDVTTKDIYGIIKIKKIININKYLIMSFFIGISIIIFLSNIIFDIEVVHNDKSIRQLITKELKNYNIEKYKFKKSFNELQTIKQEILNKYKNKIEWLEINIIGTKYVIKVQERLIIDNNDNNNPQNIISKKDAIIKKIISNKGQVIRKIDEYVKKGSIIIDGNIKLYDSVKDTVKADGTIYGEVWYEINVEYPFIYEENKLTGKIKEVYVLKIFNKELSFNSFKNKIVDNNIILKNKVFPLQLVKQKQKEIIKISQILSFEEANKKAIELAILKIKDKLNDDEKIIDYKVLNAELNENKIKLKIFFSVLENITEVEEIKDDLSKINP